MKPRNFPERKRRRHLRAALRLAYHEATIPDNIGHGSRAEVEANNAVLSRMLVGA